MNIYRGGGGEGEKEMTLNKRLFLTSKFLQFVLMKNFVLNFIIFSASIILPD